MRVADDARKWRRNMGEISDDDEDVNEATDALVHHARYHGLYGIADKLEAGQPFVYGSHTSRRDPELTTPNPARMYDFYLGGRANFAVDRHAAKKVIAAYPGVVAAAWANRSFLRRAVGYLAGQGIDQFLDLGSGIPTVGNVHEIAQHANPRARVVYVDIEPIATAHSAAMLAGNHQASVIRADLAEPSTILGHQAVRDLLDLSRPIAVLLVSVLTFLPESADPSGVVAAYRDAIAPGSYLVISHGCTELTAADALDVRDAQAIYERTTSPVTMRTRKQITELFTGLDLVEPGLVPVTDWHPADADSIGHATTVPVLAGVARKR